MRWKWKERKMCESMAMVHALATVAMKMRRKGTAKQGKLIRASHLPLQPTPSLHTAKTNWILSWRQLRRKYRCSYSCYQCFDRTLSSDHEYYGHWGLDSSRLASCSGLFAASFLLPPVITCNGWPRKLSATPSDTSVLIFSIDIRRALTLDGFQYHRLQFIVACLSVR